VPERRMPEVMGEGRSFDHIRVYNANKLGMPTEK
jgi:hypothetical protein